MPDIDLDYPDIKLEPFGGLDKIRDLEDLVNDRFGGIHRHVPDPEGDGDGVDPRFVERISPYLRDRGSLLAIIDYLTRRQTSSWAVLVVSFSDDPAPSQDLTKYRKVFTSDGSGTMNMVDYFSDMSHGKLDLSGSDVFGPYVLPRPRADYVGNVYPQPAGKLNRNGVLDLARATATAAGVELSQYAGVVVCGTPTLDLCGWVGGGAALCDDLSLQPSLLGQEMGHGYGADHSRIDGSTDDYQDPWDTMSTANAFEAVHPDYGRVGPGLNAVNMQLRGWLDTSRVLYLSDSTATEQTVVLRPLHARHLPGTLAVSVGGYLVELRVRSRWDAGIPQACVLVHRGEANRSYLMRAADGSPDLTDGDEFTVGIEGGLFGHYVKVHVDAIDEANQTAQVRISYAPAYYPHVPELVGRVLGGAPVDGDGIIVIGGKPHRIPPRGPETVLVDALADYLDAATPIERTAALDRMATGLGQAVRDIEVVSETPPGL